MIQIADITGIYGVSFLVVAVNGALADIFLIKKRTKDMPLFPCRILLSVLLFFCLILVNNRHLRADETERGATGRTI